MLIYRDKQYSAMLTDAENWKAGVFLLPGENEEGQRRLASALKGKTGFAWLTVEGIDWNRDLSPWPAPRAFRGGDDFSGGGEAYREWLLTRAFPAAEEKMGGKPGFRGIAGYSLAGLFAADCFVKGGFDAMASVSGSLWYDGWSEWLKNNAGRYDKRLAYFSVGDKEANTKNERLRPVQASTEWAEGFFREHGAITRFELNPGNHFYEPERRTAKGLEWIIQEWEAHMR